MNVNCQFNYCFCYSFFQFQFKQYISLVMFWCSTTPSVNYFVASQKQVTLIHVYLISSLQNKNMIDEMIFLKCLMLIKKYIFQLHPSKNYLFHHIKKAFMMQMKTYSTSGNGNTPSQIVCLSFTSNNLCRKGSKEL